MKLSNEDIKLLKELCSKHQVSFTKVIKLLDTEQEFEFKDRRTGIYDALRDIVKTSFSEEVSR
ncbi:MAG: DNA modification system-associated small protein [Pseudomonadota bacterium]